MARKRRGHEAEGGKGRKFWRNGYLQAVMLRIVSRVVEVTESVAGGGGRPLTRGSP